MLAENFDMETYPSREGGTNLENKEVSMPATRFWRIGYLDKNGLDKWYTHSLASPSWRIPEKDIPLIEKSMKAAKIVTIRFGCMWIQEEQGGDWKETVLSRSAPEPQHYFEGPYTQLYFRMWRPEAYRYTKDLFEYKLPTSSDEFNRNKMSLHEAALKAKDREIENLKKLLQEQKNVIQNKAVETNSGLEGKVAAMVEAAQRGAKVQGMA